MGELSVTMKGFDAWTGSLIICKRHELGLHDVVFFPPSFLHSMHFDYTSVNALIVLSSLNWLYIPNMDPNFLEFKVQLNIRLVCTL